MGNHRTRDADLPVVSGPYSRRSQGAGFVVPTVIPPRMHRHSSGATVVGWVDPATEPVLISPPPTRRP